MIIKSHIRGGFRDAAAYLKEQGQNEKTRLVEISDPHASDLDEAFRAMWAITNGTKVKKPIHHVSINPMKDERLTDEQVRRICERLEEKYGYVHSAHQRVIVEHIKDGRQHFHVMWNRVSLRTGKTHWPYMHKKQSKITAREMETELGLKRPVSRRKAMFSPYKRQIRLLRHLPVDRPPFWGPLRISRRLRFKRSPPEKLPMPIRPHASENLSGLSEAQRIDFLAACHGRITWWQYFQKWGRTGMGLNC
jgi:hypothetical protein